MFGAQHCLVETSSKVMNSSGSGNVVSLTWTSDNVSNVCLMVGMYVVAEDTGMTACID